MAHQRGHREPGDLEVGANDVFIRRPTPHVAARAAKPTWFLNWENRRPRWALELIAEAFGVALYCWGGMGATAAFFTASAAKEEGFGSLQTVAFCYAFAIAFAILIVGPTSGSHLNPCFTISFAVFKGFPWRKVPQYIIAQVTGGMIGGLLVYWQYKPKLDLITEELRAAGLAAQVYTPSGPAGTIALFLNPGQTVGNTFVNEFIGATVIAIVVFSVLDPSNIFVAPAGAPFVIGFAYFVVISCFASNGVALNTARDLGGRLAAACIWGRKCFPARYTALAALTNILASLVGGAFQTFILSDTNRPHVHVPPSADEEEPLPVQMKHGNQSMSAGQPQYEKSTGSDIEHREH